MIRLEEKEQKYSLEKHKKRLRVIIENWDEIVKIINEELPTVEEFEAILDTIEAPKSVAELGMDESILPMTLKSTKDIRDNTSSQDFCGISASSTTSATGFLICSL